MIRAGLVWLTLAAPVHADWQAGILGDARKIVECAAVLDLLDARPGSSFATDGRRDLAAVADGLRAQVRGRHGVRFVESLTEQYRDKWLAADLTDVGLRLELVGVLHPCQRYAEGLGLPV